MPVRTPKALSLALFWLGIQAVWGALLGISLQSRTIELASGDAQLASNQLAAMGAVAAAIVQLIVGFWSDARRGGASRRIEFYVIGAAVGAAALLFFYDARSFAALTAAFIVLQAGLNVAIGPYQAIIPDFVERARTGRASAWMAALQSAGNAIGALAASFIASARLLAASLSALLLATCAITAAHAKGLQLREAPTGRMQGLTITRAFVDLFISRALVYAGFYTLLYNLFFYVTRVLGATAEAAPRETGILIVAFTLVGTLGAALAARPSDRLDKRLVANIGGAGFILALALFIGSHTFAATLLAALIAGTGWGAFLVADWAIACRVLPANALAAAMGVWNLAVLTPQFFAPALTFVVLAHFGATTGPEGPRIAFALALGETLLGIAWLWRLSRCAIGE
jgi:MFS family permease